MFNKLRERDCQKVLRFWLSTPLTEVIENLVITIICKEMLRLKQETSQFKEELNYRNGEAHKQQNNK